MVCLVFLIFFPDSRIKTMMATQQLLQISCSKPDMEEREEVFSCFFFPFAKPVQRKDEGYLPTFCSWGKAKTDTRKTEVSIPVFFPISLFMYPSSDGTGKDQQWCFK